MHLIIEVYDKKKMTNTDTDADDDGNCEGFAPYNSDGNNEVVKFDDDVEILVLGILEGDVAISSTNPCCTPGCSWEEQSTNTSSNHTSIITRTTTTAETIMQQQMENLWLARSEIQQQSSNCGFGTLSRVVELLLQRNRRLYAEISNNTNNENNIPALQYSDWIKCMKNVCGGWPCWLGANGTLREFSILGSIAATPAFKDDFPSITCC